VVSDTRYIFNSGPPLCVKYSLLPFFLDRPTEHFESLPRISFFSFMFHLDVVDGSAWVCVWEEEVSTDLAHSLTPHRAERNVPRFF